MLLHTDDGIHFQAVHLVIIDCCFCRRCWECLCGFFSLHADQAGLTATATAAVATIGRPGKARTFLDFLALYLLLPCVDPLSWNQGCGDFVGSRKRIRV